MNVEGAFATDHVISGDEVVFGRIRIRAKGAANGTYRITHPYGIDEFSVTDGAGINSTEDVGIAPGAFGGALRGRVGPYLTWDTFGSSGPDAPPKGYIGDPAVPHAVKGSPYGTNLVRVERKDAAGNYQTIGTTTQFNVQGRLARTGGVDVQQATYRTMDDGTKVIEVFASSETGQAIRLIAPDLGYKGITLEEDDFSVTAGGSSHQEGRYYGRFAIKPGVAVTGGADATKIVVQNAGDVPVSSQDRLPSRTSSRSRTRPTTARSLTIAANSSDSAAKLTVQGYGDLTGGSTSFGGVDAPPHVITVTSDEGGSATVPLDTSGPFTAPDLPVAAVWSSPDPPDRRPAGDPGRQRLARRHLVRVDPGDQAGDSRRHPRADRSHSDVHALAGPASTSSRSSRSGTPDAARHSRSASRSSTRLADGHGSRPGQPRPCSVAPMSPSTAR